MAKSQNRNTQVTSSLKAIRENTHKIPRILSYFEGAVVEVISQLSARTSRADELQSELESNVDSCLIAFESINTFKPHVSSKAARLSTNASTSELKKIWTPAFAESFLLLAVLSPEKERVQKIVNHKNSGFPPAMVKRCNEFLGQDLSLEEKLTHLKPDIFPQGIFDDIPEDKQTTSKRLGRWVSRAWKRVAGGSSDTESNSTVAATANEIPLSTYDISDEFRSKILDLFERASNAQTGAEMKAVWEGHNRLHTFDAITNLDEKGLNTLIQLDRLWSANILSAELDASHIFSIVFLDSFKLSEEYLRQKNVPDGIFVSTPV